jgi:hypothetical protein
VYKNKKPFKGKSATREVTCQRLWNDERTQEKFETQWNASLPTLGAFDGSKQQLHPAMFLPGITVKYFFLQRNTGRDSS